LKKTKQLINYYLLIITALLAICRITFHAKLITFYAFLILQPITYTATYITICRVARIAYAVNCILITHLTPTWTSRN